jgi:hypothetical protein
MFDTEFNMETVYNKLSKLSETDAGILMKPLTDVFFEEVQVGPFHESHRRHRTYMRILIKHLQPTTDPENFAMNEILLHLSHCYSLIFDEYVAYRDDSEFDMYNNHSRFCYYYCKVLKIMELPSFQLHYFDYEARVIAIIRNAIKECMEFDSSKYDKMCSDLYEHDADNSDDDSKSDNEDSDGSDNEDSD